jgi:two-component system, chemotaxis family, protein-glutamate methylesterase/glutaminase
LSTRDIIVIGGSAGAVEAMQELVRALPRDLPAAVFMVLHVSPDFPSMMPKILDRAGPLPAKHAQDGEPVRPGQIFVAPPDRHLTVQDGIVRVTRGPRENRHRPAIDTLFRSAARAYDSRVIGVLLSGHMDDGAAGLSAIRARGGLSVVQDPEDALVGQMPRSALQYGGADYVLPIAEIGPQLSALVDHSGSTDMNEEKTKSNSSKNEVFENLTVSRPHEGHGTPSPFSCPECGGVLWELNEGELARFRCRVGHAYTMTTLADEQTDAVEEALWAAMRALEEKAALATRLSESSVDARAAIRLREQAQDDRDYAETLRKVLFRDDKEKQLAG